MTKKKAVEVGILLLTIGGGLIAIISVRKDLEPVLPFLPNLFYKTCLLLGFALCVVGVLLIVLPVETIQKIVQRIKDFFGMGDRPYETKPAKWKDLKLIHEYAKQELGAVSDLQKMEQWFNINRQIFWIVIDSAVNGTHGQQMVGYYAIIPLNKVATDLLETEKIEGTSFAAEHIIPYRRGRIRKTPASIYVGGVAAKNRMRIRQFVLGSLVAHLNQEIENGVKAVFSRPVTNDGLRLIKKYNFKPVNQFVETYEMKHIYKRDFSADGNM
jgi:hypothetical protein